MFRQTRRHPTQISEAVLRLAGVARAALAPVGRPVSIDPPLAEFAIRRHRIGPLAAATAALEATALDEGVALQLSQHSQANARRMAIATMVQARVIHALTGAGIPSLLFKGQPLAALLYPNARLRHAGDIDFLVRPADFAAAAASLAGIGFESSSPDLVRRGALARLAAHLLRDIGMRDPVSGQGIELHQRLLFSRPLSAAILARNPSFQPRLPARPTDIPTPASGPGLALYLLLHGAISAWWRLKWLVDVMLLVPRLDSSDAEALAAMAEDCGCAASIKAGLMLMQEVFDVALPDPLQSWTRESGGDRAAQRRLHYYAAMLCQPSASAPNPANSRLATLTSNFWLAERIAPRIDLVLHAPAASGLRLLDRWTGRKG